MARYTQSVVTYLDILGFRQLVETATDPEEVAGRLSAFMRFSEPLQFDVDSRESGFTNFSDLVVRAVPVQRQRDSRGGVLLTEILDLVYAQAKLAENRVLVRGAVTVGELFRRDHLIFGPGLVRAYELESTVALFPRIIFDPTIFAILTKGLELYGAGDPKEELGDIRNLLALDSDGVWFLDYLRSIALSFGQDRTDYFRFLSHHKTMIVDQFAHFQTLSRVAAKFNWLALYHNSVIRSLNNDEMRAVGLSASALSIDLEGLPPIHGITGV